MRLEDFLLPAVAAGIRGLQEHVELMFPDLGLRWTLATETGSPWIRVLVEASEPYDCAITDLPRRYAIWCRTGAVHRVRGGAAQDPPILAPK